MDCEYQDIAIETVSISPLNLFISYGYITGEVHIYSLINELDKYFDTFRKRLQERGGKLVKQPTSIKKGINSLTNCSCLEDFENSLKKEKSTSIFSKFASIKNYFFTAKVKKLPFSTLMFQSAGKPFTSYFEKRNEITFVSENLVQKFKFSSAEGGRGWCFKSITFNQQPEQGLKNKVPEMLDDYEIISEEQI